MLRILKQPFIKITKGTIDVVKNSNHISKTIIMIQSILVYTAFTLIHNFYDGKVVVNTKKQLLFTLLTFEYTNKKYFSSVLYKLPATLTIILLLLLLGLLFTNYLTHLYNVAFFVFFVIQALYIPNTNL